VIAQTHKDFIHWAHPVIPRIVEPYLSQVRAAQQSVAAKSEFARLVDVDDIPLTTDSNHFDSAGLQVVGQRFADAYFGIVPQPPSGDFNEDGTVDAADYVVWRKGLGTTHSQTDYEVWRARFGELGDIPSAAPRLPTVPEPSAIALSGLVTTNLLALRRRHRSFLGTNGQRHDLRCVFQGTRQILPRFVAI
jgi:hypothetical protein